MVGENVNGYRVTVQVSAIVDTQVSNCLVRLFRYFWCLKWADDFC